MAREGSGRKQGQAKAKRKKAREKRPSIRDIRIEDLDRVKGGVAVDEAAFGNIYCW